MTYRLAIVRIRTGAVEHVFSGGRAYVDIPGTKIRVPSPTPGWEGGGELVYARKVLDAATGEPLKGGPKPDQLVKVRYIASEGPPRYRIVMVVDDAVGKWQHATRVASFRYNPDVDRVEENRGVKDMPAAQVNAALIARVKSDAGQRIVAIVPEWKQRNLIARAALLSRKGEANWSADDSAAWAAGEAVWNRVVAIRSNSDAAEQVIIDSPTPADKQAAYDAIVWPS